MSLPLLLVLLSNVGVGDVEGAVTANITLPWNTGFNAKATMVTPQVMDGWRIRVIFDKPVDSLSGWNEDTTKISDREFVLSNKDYNAHMDSNFHYNLDMQGTHSGDPPTSFCAYWEGIESGQECRQTATSRATTSTSTTTTTTTTVPTTTSTASSTTTTTPETTTTTATSNSPTKSPITTATTTTSTAPTTTTLTTQTEQATSTLILTASSAMTTTDLTPMTGGHPNTYQTATSSPMYVTTTKDHGVHVTHGVGPSTTAPVNASLTWPQGSKNYAEALRLSLLFYYAQRSGQLPADNPIPWRNDSALTDCVTGGWYDAGDNLKSVFPMAGALTLLLWGVDRFQDGYQTAGQLDSMYDTVRWGLDFLAHTWNPFSQEMVVQIGDPVVDHQYWVRPEDMASPRPCVKVGPGRPGSDVAGQAVAALAAGAIVFRDKGDTDYALHLLETAQSLYRFAAENRGLYSESTGQLQYISTNDKDEMCQAGVWLYRATGDETYLINAKREHEGIIPTELSWDDKMLACHLLLYESAHSWVFRRDVENFLSTWLPGENKQYTPCAMAWTNSTTGGSAMHAASVAFAALLAAEDGINPEVNRKWAVEQLNYMLGDNSHDGGCFSYEIGYGNKYPTHTHHRAASCPDLPAPCNETSLHAQSANPHVLSGGLVGGPDLQDGFTDTRIDDVHNQPNMFGNAGFQSALAGLMHLVSTNQFPHPENQCACPE